MLTLSHNGIERALADWGIDLASATLTLRGWQADELSFQLAVPDAFALRSFVYGDDIALKQDGIAIFVGKLRRRPVYGGPAERQRYVAYNYWYDLERLVYEQQRRVIDESFVDLNLVATTQVVFGRDTATGAKIDTQSEITNLCYYAATHGVAMAYDLSFTGLVAPWEQANDVMVASGLRRMAAWLPNLLARSEYGTGVGVLRVRNPNVYDVNAVDLTAADSIIGLECERRDDMRPLGVVFNFITSEVNPATGERFMRVTAQTGGAYFSGPGVIKATLPISDSETIPANLAYNYYAALATVFLEGRLTTKGVEISNAIKPGNLLLFSHGSPEWDSTFAPVSEVVHELGTGVSTVAFGPPTFLPASSFAALNGRMKDRPNPPEPPRDPGNDGGGDADNGGGGGGGPTFGQQHLIEVCEDGVSKTISVMGA